VLDSRLRPHHVITRRSWRWRGTELGVPRQILGRKALQRPAKATASFRRHWVGVMPRWAPARRALRLASPARALQSCGQRANRRWRVGARNKLVWGPERQSYLICDWPIIPVLRAVRHPPSHRLQRTTPMWIQAHEADRKGGTTRSRRTACARWPRMPRPAREPPHTRSDRENQVCSGASLGPHQEGGRLGLLSTREADCAGTCASPMKLYLARAACRPLDGKSPRPGIRAPDATHCR